MPEILLAPGEIRLTSFEVMTPDKVQEIGALLLGYAAEMKDEHAFALEERYKVVLFDSRRGYAQAEMLEDMHQFYTDLLRSSAVDFTHCVTWLIHGQLDNLSWHIDKAGDVRFLFNVGEPTSVDLAEEWDPELYKPGDTGYPAPTLATTMELGTGSMYAVNNLVTDPNLLRPHQTPEQLSRVVLRTCFYAADGWQEQASDGGVPISLVLSS